MWNNDLKVRDVMNHPAITVEPDATTKQVVETMLANDVSSVPVVTPEHGLVGIITDSDLVLRAAYGKTSPTGLALVAEIIQGRPAAWVDRVHAQTAADLMTHEVVTCNPDETAVEVARRLLYHRFKHLPVVDGGRVAGVISRHDLLRTLVEDDPPVLHHPDDPVQDVQELSPDECLRLIRLKGVGRVGYVVEDQPVILPVNYVVNNGLIVFRSDRGEKLDSIPMRRVAFEVDEVRAGIAWSVLVRGHAREVTTALGPAYEALRAVPIARNVPGLKQHWIAIEITSITGRRIGHFASS
jgi:CBS domain-containing protein